MEEEGLHSASSLALALAGGDLAGLATPLLARAAEVYRENLHGNWGEWRAVREEICTIAPPTSGDFAGYDFSGGVVRIGGDGRGRLGEGEVAELRRLLLRLMPWRKGPFEFLGVGIDSEWRADWKWGRLRGKISALRGRRVLDVGCGNGYYLWRMLGEGAELALGIDPSQLFVAQFRTMKRYCGGCAAFVLPLTSAQFSAEFSAEFAGRDGVGFDTAFSMGVLSHRREPKAHLRELVGVVRDGGEVVVESLVVDGGADEVLRPRGRYAKMRNVYALPSVLALEGWLREAGVREVECVDVGYTTVEEQRATEWMPFESLVDFLAPSEEGEGGVRRTIEGYPAPQRAIFVGRKAG